MLWRPAPLDDDKEPLLGRHIFSPVCAPVLNTLTVRRQGAGRDNNKYPVGDRLREAPVVVPLPENNNHPDHLLNAGAFFRMERRLIVKMEQLPRRKCRLLSADFPSRTQPRSVDTNVPETSVFHLMETLGIGTE